MKKLLGLILVICLMAGIVPASMEGLVSEDRINAQIVDLFTVTLPTNLAFSGEGKAITFTPKVEGTGEIYVMYHDESEEGWIEIPKIPGTYIASVSMGGTAVYEAVEAEENEAWKFTIVPKTLTITGLTVSKTYDGTTDATATGTAALSGVVEGYPVELTGSLTSVAFKDANAGENKEVIQSGFELAGDSYDMGCYTLSITGTITPKAVTITAKAQTVQQNGEIATGVDQVEASGLVSGHTVSEITLESSGTDTPTTEGTITPKSAKIVDANGNDVTNNYAITYANGTLTVEEQVQVERVVTFKVLNGSWDDETTADKTVPLTGENGNNPTLPADKIPAVGNNPNKGYKAGSWDTTPSAGAEIAEDTTYTYTYAQKEPISATVTFKVVNGFWGDGTTADKSVPLTGENGNNPTLPADKIPAVGANPGNIYKAGSWDTTPVADTTITKDTTYTYTYAEKEPISATVTFKVENGSWGDGTAADKPVQLTGLEGETLTLSADKIPTAGADPSTGYKAGSWDTTPTAGTTFEAGTATTYTYTYAEKEPISATVTFMVENGAWNDETTANKSVTLTGLEGETLTLPADKIPTAGAYPADEFKAGSWSPVPVADTAIEADTTYTYTYIPEGSISATVTFRVAYGAWNDGSIADKSVMLTGSENDPLVLPADKIPAVGTQPSRGRWSYGSWDTTPAAGTEITEDTTYTYTYKAKKEVSATATFRVVNGAWDDESKKDIIIKITGFEGDTLLLPVDKIPAVGDTPDDGYAAGEWDRDFSSELKRVLIPNRNHVYTYYYYGSTLDNDSNFVICGLQESYDYIGKKITPDFIVMDLRQGVVLSKGTDYTVKYGPNKNVGTGTITIKGKGNYQGKGKQVEFQIVDPKARAEGTLVSGKITKVTLSERDFVYNGKAQYPKTVTIELKDAGTCTATYNGEGGYDVTGLPEGQTIAISVGNNVNKGTASLMVSTADKETKVNFKIKAADISTARIPDGLEAPYSIKGTIPDGFAVYWVNGDGEEVELIAGQDFTAKFKVDKGGHGTIKVTSKGNFRGKLEGSFNTYAFAPGKITAVIAYEGLKVKAVKVTIVDPSGKEVPSKMRTLTVLDADGIAMDKKTELQAGDQIQVVVKSNDPSKYDFGEDGLTETVTVGKSIGKAKIDSRKYNKPYTGKPIELTEEDMKSIPVTYKVGKEWINLVYGTDYEIVGYMNNIKKGSMTVILQGIGKYSGSKTFKVKIVPATLGNER